MGGRNISKWVGKSCIARSTITTVSVPLLYHVTNIWRQQIPSTATKQLSKLQDLSRWRKQILFIVTSSRDLNPNANGNFVISSSTLFIKMQYIKWQCAIGEASFHAKKIIPLHPCKMSKQRHSLTCKHYRMFSYLFHSVIYYSSVYVHVQALPMARL